MNIQSLVQDVQAYTQHRLPQYVEELREVCSIDTNSSYKPGLDELATVLAARLRGIGVEVTMFQQEQWGNDLLGVVRGEGTGKVVLLGRTDTHYPVGTGSMQPVRVEENKAYGPGVSVEKGGILSAICAIEAMLAMNYRAFGEVCFLCVSDAQLDSRHSAELTQMVLQNSQAALVLEPARTNGNLVSARKGRAVYTLRVQGRAAHAGINPEQGRNAVMELAHQLLQFQSLNGWRDGLSITPGAMSGGTEAKMVPDYGEIRIDLHFLATADRLATEERWHEMMQQCLIPDVTVTLDPVITPIEPMICTPETMKLVHLAQEVAGNLGFSLGHMQSGGCSDGNIAQHYGASVLDGLGPIGGLYNSPGEYLQLDSVPPRTALLAGLIASVGIE